MAVGAALGLHGGEDLPEPLGAQGKVQKAGAGQLHLVKVGAAQVHVIRQGLGDVPGGLSQGLGGGQGVVYHGGGIRPLVLLDDVHPRPLGPDGELLRRRRPEGVPGAQQHLFALPLPPGGQLADGGGLAHPVHPDEQHHGGGVHHVHGQVPGGEVLRQDVPHTLAGSLDVLDLLRLTAAFQLLHRLQGGLRA